MISAETIACDFGEVYVRTVRVGEFQIALPRNLSLSRGGINHAKRVCVFECSHDGCHPQAWLTRIHPPVTLLTLYLHAQDRVSRT